jgi:hypothetical protein
MRLACRRREQKGSSPNSAGILTRRGAWGATPPGVERALLRPSFSDERACLRAMPGAAFFSTRAPDLEPAGRGLVYRFHAPHRDSCHVPSHPFCGTAAGQLKPKPPARFDTAAHTASAQFFPPLPCTAARQFLSQSFGMAPHVPHGSRPRPLGPFSSASPHGDLSPGAVRTLPRSTRGPGNPNAGRPATAGAGRPAARFVPPSTLRRRSAGDTLAESGWADTDAYQAGTPQPCLPMDEQRLGTGHVSLQARRHAAPSGRAPHIGSPGPTSPR